MEIYGFEDSDTLDDLRPGFICRKKLVMVEDWTADEELQCRHVTQESCFQTMKTIYKTVKVLFLKILY